MGKVCGQCNNFIGFGDWNLCCTKSPELTYEYSDATNCNNFDQTTICKNVSRIIGAFRCSICGEYKSFVKYEGKVSIGELMNISNRAADFVKTLKECPMCGEVISK